MKDVSENWSGVMPLVAVITVIMIIVIALNPSACTTSPISPKEIHNLINIERVNSNLPAIKWNNRMQGYAQSQSDAMAKEDKLFHSNRAALQGGENVWSGEGHSWSAKDVVQSWMNSSEHRAWILDSRVIKAGVGVSISSGSTYVAWSFEGGTEDSRATERRTERTVPVRRTERGLPDRSTDRSVSR